MKTIVCRCEDVTLADLDEAIARGHHDIESLKRYTGFGTGWCQGKWCLVPCARRLLEKGGDATLPITPRPPYHPVSLAALAGSSGAPQPLPPISGEGEPVKRVTAQSDISAPTPFTD